MLSERPDRYAEKRFRKIGTKRAMDGAQKAFDEVCGDILDYDERKPEAERMEEHHYDARVEALRLHLRHLFITDKITDAAELKRRGRKFCKLPKRLSKPKP